MKAGVGRPNAEPIGLGCLHVRRPPEVGTADDHRIRIIRIQRERRDEAGVSVNGIDQRVRPQHAAPAVQIAVSRHDAARVVDVGGGGAAVGTAGDPPEDVLAEIDVGIRRIGGAEPAVTAEHLGPGIGGAVERHGPDVLTAADDGTAGRVGGGPVKLRDAELIVQVDPSAIRRDRHNIVDLVNAAVVAEKSGPIGGAVEERMGGDHVMVGMGGGPGIRDQGPVADLR